MGVRLVKIETDVVMFSGGSTSWAAAKRVAAREDCKKIILLCANTKIEDEDWFRFVQEAAANVGGDLIMLEEGRTPWEVFFDVRYLGNSRVDPCSKILKRDMLNQWLKDNCDPAQTRIAMGFDFTEAHRLERMQGRDHWYRWAPLLERPWLTKQQINDWLLAEGIAPPRLYALGFSHNNCGGTCVKAGQTQWKRVLEVLPERYLEWEEQEQKFMREIGSYTILKDRRGGQKKNMSLREFRERVQAGKDYDQMDFGVCGCFVAEEE